METASELKTAVLARLAESAALVALLGGMKVYGEPPRTAAHPYITIGECRSLADDEHQLTLHAWSRQGGYKEAHSIAGAILEAIDDAPLTLATNSLVNFRFAVADIRREADQKTYHGLVRFRAVTEPKSP